MFPNKLILQSLITVPKNLQLYTAASVNSSKLAGQTRANLHNVPCVENRKNGTLKNIFNNITGTGRRKEVNRKYSSFSIPLDVFKKVRKVNHNTQITKIFHQRTKTNILTKSRIIHQDTRIPLTARNGNRIFKHRPQVLQNTLRFITNRSSILPPPSSGNSKNIDVPLNSNQIPSYKINVKFNGTIPPPTSRNENLIRDQNKDIPESSFNITMSKGRKVRPPSGTEKRCMSSGRIFKASTIRKFNDFNLLKNKESLLKTLKCFIHTTQPMTDEEKSKSIANLDKITKSIDETKQKEIYYKQHFPKQPFSCPFYKSNDDKIDSRQLNEFKKNRHFIKSYLRPVNLPPPTPKRLNMQTSNSTLTPVYSLEVKNDLTPSLSIKQKTKSPLLDLLEKTKRVVEDNELPLNLNFSTSEGLRNVFEGDDDPKKTIYVKMQGNTFRSDSYNCLNGDKDSQNDIEEQLINENRKPEVPSFNSFDNNNDDKASYETNNVNNNASVNEKYDNSYSVDMVNRNFVEKSLKNYTTDNEDPSICLKPPENVSNKSEDEENTSQIESSNTNSTYTSHLMDNDRENEQENKLDTQASSTYNEYLESTESKSNSSPKNDDTIQIKIYEPDSDTNNTIINRNIYNIDENEENKENFQVSNTNNEVSTDRSDNKEDDQENKINFQSSPNMNNTLSTVCEVHKMDENQEPKFNFHAANISDALSQERSHKIMEEDQANKNNFQASNMNDTTDSNVQKMDETQENKVNFQASSMNNVLSTERVDKIEDNQEMKMNLQTTDMDNAMSNERSGSNVHKINEPQENKVNYETFGANNLPVTMSSATNQTETNYNNAMSKTEECPETNAYFNAMNVSNLDVPEVLNDENKYSGEETQQNRANMQPANVNNNTETMDTMTNNLPRTEETQAMARQYFDAINKIETSTYNNEANQMMNENNMSQNMYPGMTNVSDMNSPENMAHGSRKTEVRKPGKRLMKSLQFMKNSKGLAELAKTFNHASMFIPKQNLWRKFKFPAPSSSTYYPTNNDSSAQSAGIEKEIPKFKNFKDAREYFVQPDNLKKLTPSQIAMYNSILYYENVIKKHSDEIKRQRNNLETTQQALKHRKNKFYKHKSNFE